MQRSDREPKPYALGFIKSFPPSYSHLTNSVGSLYSRLLYAFNDNLLYASMTVSFANITAVRTALPKYQHQQLGGWIGITKEFWMKMKLLGKVRRYDGKNTSYLTLSTCFWL